MTYKDAYVNKHDAFTITNIEYEEDGGGPSEIEPEYAAPDIAVDAAGRFVTHEIIGGTTVRQKIGEDPLEIEVNGVCAEGVAATLDGLRNAKQGTLVSKRLNGTIDVQFASISTSPFETGGAVAGETEEFLYEYDISAVEI